METNNYHSVYSPSWKTFWILIDLDNGHKSGNTYFWTFGTKKEALKHRKMQHTRKHGARLSYPIKVGDKEQSPSV